MFAFISTAGTLSITPNMRIKHLSANITCATSCSCSIRERMRNILTAISALLTGIVTVNKLKVMRRSRFANAAFVFTCGKIHPRFVVFTAGKSAHSTTSINPIMRFMYFPASAATPGRVIVSMPVLTCQQSHYQRHVHTDHLNVRCGYFARPVQFAALVLIQQQTAVFSGQENFANQMIHCWR